MDGRLQELLCGLPSAHPDRLFRDIADRLLGSIQIIVGTTPFRLREIEFYASNDDHRDPFAHRHPDQTPCATWYFHRRGRGFLGGTYKGLDVTFGGPNTFGGILLRTIESDSGEFISGPSKVVDAILDAANISSVPALARVSLDASVWETNRPLHLVSQESPAPISVLTTPRVGLSLKRVHAHPSMTDYFDRPYRFLTAPKRIPKGRLQTAIALHQRGLDVSTIQQETGTRTGSLQRWTSAYENGRRGGDVERFWGQAPSGDALAHLYGALASVQGSRNRASSST